jgi:NodT family efflux transporter outer membrane factor (OMF) lipoprotein
MALALPERFGAGREGPDAAAEALVAPEALEVEAGAWWRSFDDPALDAIILEALAGNHDLKAAAARVFASAAEARIVGADPLPQLALGLDAARAKRSFVGLPVPGGNDVLTTRSTAFGLSLDLTWEIDLWGRLRSRTSAALADLEAQAADHEAARLSLAAQAARLWFRISEAGRQVELARATVESFRATSLQVRDRYERGLRPPLDLRLALANAAGAEAVLAARREGLDRLKRQLEILLGRYPTAGLRPGNDLPPVPPPVPAGLPADLLLRRPDLKAAERRLQASAARLRAAKADLLPRLSLTAAGGTLSDELSDLLDESFSVWALAGNMLQPVFQGGRLIAGVDLAEASQVEALESYFQEVLAACGDVETTLAAESFLAEGEAALRLAAEESVAARALAEDRYAGGLDTFIVLLEAQRRAFTAESELLEVRRLRLEARVDLHLALGGGFLSPS